MIVAIVPSYGERYLSSTLYAGLMDEFASRASKAGSRKIFPQNENLNLMQVHFIVAAGTVALVHA